MKEVLLCVSAKQYKKTGQVFSFSTLNTKNALSASHKKTKIIGISVTEHGHRYHINNFSKYLRLLIFLIIT